MKRSAIALALCAACAVPATVPAFAGDGAGLKLPGKPGLLYQFNTRTRRGVTVEDDATLELRFDGCWTAKTALTNTAASARTVSVTVEFLDEAGRPLDAVPVVQRQRVDGLAATTIDRTNCSPALAASYSLQRCWKVRRIVSAW